MKKAKKAIVWGDSVARGVVFDESRNRYRLAPCPAASYIAKERNMEITNRSRMGMTSSEGVEMLEKDLRAGLRADLAVLEFGGNDCDFDWQSISDTPEEEHLCKTPPALFEKIYTELLTKAKAFGSKVFALNLPPIVPARYFKKITEKAGICAENVLKWLGSVETIYRYQEMYSIMVE